MTDRSNTGASAVTASAARYRDAHVAYWDSVAKATWQGLGGAYHRRLAGIYRFLVAPGQRVLEVGCAEGDLLAAVRPSEGVGVDFSPAMIGKGRARHPEFTFVLADAHEMALDGTFDAVILSDLTHDVWDVQGVLARVARHVHPKTRIIVNSYSRLWELPLEIAKVMGLARPKIAQNWLTVQDLTHLLDLTDFEVIRHWEEILWPLPLPLLGGLFNRFLVKVWPFHVFAMTNFVVARPRPRPDASVPAPRVSVVVPARNEAGNVAAIFARTPELGAGTELIFVEGNSTDDTRATIEAAIKAHPERDAKLYVQAGKGKGDAVRLGFAKATGGVLMILDADLTVPPEDLPRFYEALATGKGDMINGVRLVYPMEREAMRFFNLLANKGFSLVFWWLLGQPV